VGAPRIGLTPYAPPLLDLIREPDADVRCWRLATTIAGLADGWIPAALQPFRDRPDLVARYVDRERAVLAADLLGWASGRSEVARRFLRLVCTLEPRADETAAFVFEARVTTPRVADAPRTLAQLQGLRTEALRDGALFPPEHVGVLEWLADHAASAGGPYGGVPRLTVAMPLALLERAANSPLAVWADDLDPALAARGGIRAGDRVRLATAEARLVPECVERDDHLWVELRYRWPDGTQRALDEAVYVSGGAPYAGWRGTLVLADGVLAPLADEPPRPLLARFRTVGALPLEADDRSEFVGALATRFPHLRDTLAAHS